MRCLLLTVIPLLLAGCSDVITDRYATRQAAEADQLFERGWLPEIIPASSHHITTRNDLDSNTSEGEFSFAPSEREIFITKLRRMKADEVSESSQFQYLERGYWPYEFIDGTFQWIFYLHESQGHCEYVFRFKG